MSVSPDAVRAALPAYRAAQEALAHRIRESAILAIGGRDREAFLQGQLTQEVRGISIGESRPAAALSSKGKILFPGTLVGAGDRLLLLIPGACRAAAVEHLRKFAAFQRVTVEDGTEENVRIGLYGPRAAGLRPPLPGGLGLSRADEFAADWLIPRSSRREAEGSLAEAGSVEVDRATAELLRVEAGRPRFGVDIDGTNLPDEAGLGSAISATKGCYVGQEIVARRRAYGRLNRRLVGYVFPDGPIPVGTILARPRSPESPPDRTEAGRVTSSLLSPRLGPIGLGFAAHDVPVGGHLLAEGPSPRRAIVSALPFA